MLEAHYYVRKSLSLASILSQMNQYTQSHSYFLMFTLWLFELRNDF
jgi:hypothetical protein